MIERVDKITLGMDKSDVLDELGSPNRSLRKDSQDIWVYNINLENSVEVREIAFKNGFVNYVGNPRTATKKSLSQEEASVILEKELKKDTKTPHNFVDVNSDGSF